MPAFADDLLSQINIREQLKRMACEFLWTCFAWSCGLHNTFLRRRIPTQFSSPCDGRRGEQAGRAALGCVGQTPRKIAAAVASCPQLSSRLKIPSCGSCSPAGQTPSVSGSVRVIRVLQSIREKRRRWAFWSFFAQTMATIGSIPLQIVLVGLEDGMRDSGRHSRASVSDDPPGKATGVCRLAAPAYESSFDV